MNPALKNGLTARHAGDIKRYHVWPTIQQQSVAHHTWNVLRIYIELFGPPSPEITTYIVYHDVGELATGDIPFDAKRANPKLKKVVSEIDDEAAKLLSSGWYDSEDLTEKQQDMVKFCDLLEMMEFAIEEIRLGDVFYGQQIADKIGQVLREIGEKYEWFREEKIMEHVVKLIKRARSTG